MDRSSKTTVPYDLFPETRTIFGSNTLSMFLLRSYHFQYFRFIHLFLFFSHLCTCFGHCDNVQACCYSTILLLCHADRIISKGKKTKKGQAWWTTGLFLPSLFYVIVFIISCKIQLLLKKPKNKNLALKVLCFWFWKLENFKKPNIGKRLQRKDGGFWQIIISWCPKSYKLLN